MVHIINLANAQFAIPLKNLKLNFHYWIISEHKSHPANSEKNMTAVAESVILGDVAMNRFGAVLNSLACLMQKCWPQFTGLQPKFKRNNL